MAMQTPALGQWTTGLCDCFSDCSSCCCACWFPCIPVGEVVNVLENGKTSCIEGGLIFCLLQSLTGLGCFYTCTYRKKLRGIFNLPEDPCNDFCVDCCCLCCSIAQTHRELQNRGANFDKGYVPTPTNQPQVINTPQVTQPPHVQYPMGYYVQYPPNAPTIQPQVVQPPHVQYPMGYLAPSAPQPQSMNKI